MGTKPPHEDDPTTNAAENRSAEQALRESEELLRQITENIKEVFWVTDPEKNRILYISPAYEEIWGLTRKSLFQEPQSFLNAIHPADRDRVMAAMPNQVLGNYDEEYRVVQPNGDIRWVRDRAFPIEGDTGKIYRVVGIAEDITDRKLAEEALRESEDRYRQLAELSPEGIMVHTDGVITFANRSMAKMFGAASPEQLIGKFALDLAVPEERENILKRRQTVDAGGFAPLTEAKFRRLDGSITYVERTVASVIWSDRPSYLVIFRDVNERKRTEDKLHQAQKMEAVGQLTAGVAHDFNNLLAVIVGNAELIGDELGKDHPLLTTVLSATERGAALTQRLLAFSRKQVLNPKVINVNGLIADINGLLHRTLEEHIDIETVTADGLWNCEVDPAQLENALVNLAINARDAMPDGGKLTIEMANLRLDDEYAAAQAEVTPGEYVMLAVSDTGSGMSPEVCEHIFEPFFTTKGVGQGSGLGLSMVYGFIKQSGGHVTVYSEVGEGTTFKLYLPRSTRAEVATRKPTQDVVPIARGETVLVVEDDPNVRTLAVALLSSLGYQIMEAATGKMALEQLGSSTRVNLLLTDVVMPGGMNGRELALEAVRRFPGIKVLFMSGYTEDAIMHHGRLDEDAVLLQKPFRRIDLARAVRGVLDGQSD